MDKLLPTLEIVLPLFLIILLGYLIRRVKLLAPSYADASSRLLFYVLLPLLYGQDLWNTDLSQGYPASLALILILGTTFTAAAGWGAARLLRLDEKQTPSFIQSAFHGNFGYIGYALLQRLFKGIPTTVSLSFIVTITLINLYASIVYTHGAKTQSLHKRIFSVFKRVVTNPLIIGLAAGFVLNLFKVPQPKLVSSTLGMVTATASPLALLSIGLAFDIKGQKRFFKIASVLSFVKLVLSPLLGLALAFALKMPIQETLIIFVIFGTPTALSARAVDQELGGSGPLVDTGILVTTVLSLFTLTAFIFAFMSLGFLWPGSLNQPDLE